jgi:hypothetical protein
MPKSIAIILQNDPRWREKVSPESLRVGWLSREELDRVYVWFLHAYYSHGASSDRIRKALRTMGVRA